ncbi:AraC family transcriptional regulator [Aurantimonas sp. MSK8Z-1]|uniref:AraC family transcriptional regulator n=1 Tax=Mangrovibrevibacter kandeliae TaxID=2968473 RepID=UPI0021192FF6|nr:AraC family transcriptional regulator [Aurantimonas sp. MSK8Z-1]MCW4115536.1 AraC family transcriptional regulator [Aurantimonas sp. MSK8Z-1]
MSDNEDTAMPNVHEVQALEFALTPLPPADRFAVWSLLVRPLFEVSLPSADAMDGFDASVSIRFLGDDLVARATSKAQRFLRDDIEALPGGWDHIVIQLYYEGGFTGSAAGRPVTVRTGDVVVFDLARRLETVAGDFANLTLIMRREVAAPIAATWCHGQVLPREHPFCHLATAYLTHLMGRGDEMTPAEVAAALRALCIIVAQGMRGGGEVEDGGDDALRVALLAYVDTNLSRPFGIEALARALGTSRASLYRRFTDEGGVLRLVQRRRLERAREMLATAGAGASIDTIAADCGFASSATFRTAFRQQFALSPSEARGRPVLAPPEPRSGDHRLRDWVLTTRQALEAGLASDGA